MKDILGLLVLAWPLTLLVLIGITFLVVVPMAVRYAAKHGRSKWRWGVGAFLLVYLPIFWDWIPTVAVHQYYCAKESGFWVYKTLEQWKAENPGVVETLVANKVPVLVSHEGSQDNWTDAEMLNQRIKIVSKRNGPLFLHRWRWEGEWVDSKNNEVLARYVDFYTSHERRQADWSGWKFWLATDYCVGYQEKAVKFSNSIEQFKGMAK